MATFLPFWRCFHTFASCFFEAEVDEFCVAWRSVQGLFVAGWGSRRSGPFSACLLFGAMLQSIIFSVFMRSALGAFAPLAFRALYRMQSSFQGYSASTVQ